MKKKYLKRGVSKRKLIEKMIKNKSWVGIVLFVLIGFLAVVLGLAIVSGFIYYVTDSKVFGEYKVISYMATQYENLAPGEKMNTTVFDQLERDYVVVNSSGDVIAQNGEDTRGTVRAVLPLPVENNVVIVTQDLSTNFIQSDEDGEFSIDVNEFSKWFLRTLEDETKNKANNGSSLKSILVPIWIEKSLQNGSVYYGKGFVDIHLDDALFVAIFSSVLFIFIGALLIMLMVNMISIIASQKNLVNIFFLDVVTKGHNWMWFIFRGDQILRRKKYARNRYAVIDFVFVKYRNYCVSHSVEQGEKKLCEVNDGLLKLINKDEVCAHYASANFCLLLRYQDEESLKKRLESFVDTLQNIDSNHKFAFQVGVDCLGSALERAKKGKRGRKNHVDLEKEYNNACAARATLSDSDDSGIAFFDSKLVEDQKWIDIVQEEQQKALENEEFVVYYQPKYDPRTDELKGCEALIRWASPTYGFQYPGSIIPIFEKNGFITKIDDYMISHVAKDQKKWLDRGYTCVPISVNVSRAHFSEKDLAEHIRDLVDHEGCPRDLIEIELTESAFFDDKKAMITTITKMRGYGFHVSMDDFGSGYSSLNSLKDMPLDVLKLDAGFFSGDLENERGEIVVSEAIKLAKNLKMTTVAEGVEAREQVEFLARQGCDMIQGFIYDKPMPGDQYLTRMSGGTAEEQAVTPEESQPDNISATPEVSATSEVPATSEAPVTSTSEASMASETIEKESD